MKMLVSREVTGVDKAHQGVAGLTGRPINENNYGVYYNRHEIGQGKAPLGQFLLCRYILGNSFSVGSSWTITSPSASWAVCRL